MRLSVAALRHGLAALLFCVAQGDLARAQTAAHSAEQLALAQEVVELSGAESIMRDMMKLAGPQIAQTLIARGASSETAARFVEIFLEEFDADAHRVLELMALTYAASFSEAELRDLRDFYASSTGRALVARMPEITATMAHVGALVGEDVGRRAAARLTAEQQRAPENP